MFIHTSTLQQLDQNLIIQMIAGASGYSQAFAAFASRTSLLQAIDERTFRGGA